MKTIKVERLTSMFHIEEVITREVYEIEVEDNYEDDDIEELMSDYVDELKMPVNYECDAWYRVNDIDCSDTVEGIEELIKGYELDEQEFNVIEE